MRFYTKQHRYYCGIDLHARRMYICILDAAGTIRVHRNGPWLNANEFAGSLFVWGVFIGMGVAVRRDQHFRLTAVGEALSGRKRWVVETFNRLVILGVALCMIWFGYLNYLNGFGSFLMPSVTPIAVLYAALPVAGALVALFTIEELVNGWRHGFQARGRAAVEPIRPPVS